MRLVGVVALVSMLSAACALQPADGSDETLVDSPASSQPAGAAITGTTTELAPASGAPRAGSVSANPPPPTDPTQSATPSGNGPQCLHPPCSDPQPQPWGLGRPPAYLYGTQR